MQGRSQRIARRNSLLLRLVPFPPGTLASRDLSRTGRQSCQSRLLRLTLRLTGLSPPVDRNQLDYEVIEGGRAIGRMYEDRHALPELRWFWSITALVGHRPDVETTARAPTLDLPKPRFLNNCHNCP